MGLCLTYLVNCGLSTRKTRDVMREIHGILKDLIVHLNFLIKLQIGYVSDDDANTHLCLFVAYYNFLRPHSYTYWKPLNKIPELEKAELMPAKWQILIELSRQLILQQQKT